MEKNTIETATMLIKFYNMHAGTSFKSTNEKNIAIMTGALEKYSVTEIRLHIKKWVAENPDLATKRAGEGIERCIFDMEDKEDKMETSTPAPAPAPTEQAVTSSLGILEQALIEVLKKQSIPQIEKDIKAECTNILKEFVKQEYGIIERKVVTVVDGVPKKMDGVLHEKFDEVIKFVANDEPVYLVGPAGSGKNVLCKQVAEALGLKFYFTNCVTQEYKLTGFTDAMGTYQPTQFYKAFTEGGLFMLDEMDASIPEVLTILNAAIANRYFDFPAPIGYVEAHPDFRVIAAGNTIGHGADSEYVGRSAQDAASLDRFAVVEVDYSRTIEDSVAGDIELADFCRDFRASAKRAGVQVIVSYRAIGRMAKMLQLLSVKEVLKTCLIKGLEKDDVHMIEQGIYTKNKFTTALEEIVEAA